MPPPDRTPQILAAAGDILDLLTQAVWGRGVRPTSTIVFNLSSTGRKQWTADRDCHIKSVVANAGFVLSMNTSYVRATVSASNAVYTDMIAAFVAAQLFLCNHPVPAGSVIFCDGTATLNLCMAIEYD